MTNIYGTDKFKKINCKLLFIINIAKLPTLIQGKYVVKKSDISKISKLYYSFISFDECSFFLLLELEFVY